MSKTPNKWSLGQVCVELDKMAPLKLAAKWDNVGLLVEPSKLKKQSITRILLTNDLDENVLENALEQKTQLIISYHPPVFKPLKSVTCGSWKERLVVRCIEEGVAVYSPHTACDAVAGGVNDWLAEACGAADSVSVIDPQKEISKDATHKVVNFAPATHAQAVVDALSAVGCGQIGNYAQCNFQATGTGGCKGDSTTKPFFGESGKYSVEQEVRIEMVCGERALGQIKAALRSSHPYEEPPLDVYALTETPSLTTGQGRLVKLTEPTPLSVLVARVKKHLNLPLLRLAKAAGKGEDPIVKTVALCAGSGVSVIGRTKADLYLTGEMSHHELLECTAKGTSVILGEHSNTERGYLAVFKKQLESRLGEGVTVELSAADKDPVEIV